MEIVMKAESNQGDLICVNQLAVLFDYLSGGRSYLHSVVLH